MSLRPFVSSTALYVANEWGHSIYVYDLGSDRPSYEIADGRGAPTAFAIDGSGNLFVANSGSDNNPKGWVTVYRPGSKKPTRTITDGIGQLFSMAVDSAGDLFVGNRWKAQVYEYRAGSTKIARTITDGVVAVDALSVDSTGYLYVSNCQRCLGPIKRGTLTVYGPASEKLFLTIRDSDGGTGPTGFDQAGNLYADTGRNIDVYRKHTKQLLRKLPGAAGTFCFDRAGNLYSAQFRFVNSGGRVLVFAPNARTPSYVITKGIYDPASVSVDARDNLYVANAAHNEISVYASGSPTPAREITVATGLEDPRSLAFDRSDNLYVANSYESTVTVYAPGSAGVLRTITEGIVSPSGLLFDNGGNLYVGNFYGSNGIVASAFVTVYGPGASKPRLNLSKGIHGPTYASAFDRAGNLYVASGCPQSSDPITVYAPDKKSVLRTIGNAGINPCAIAFDSAGNLYVADVGLPGQVSIFAPGALKPGRVITDGIDYPEGLAFDSAGNLYVTNARGGDGKTWGSVSVYRAGGNHPLRKIKWGLHNGPTNPLFGPLGNLYVISGDEVLVYPPNGHGKPQAIRDGIRSPDALAFDGSGVLYVANDGNSTVTEYEPGSGVPFRTIPAARAYPAALIVAPR